MRQWACLLGHPVAHSLSPRLHNAAFAATGLDAHYDVRDVAPADLPQAVLALRAPACLGANVTAPHKEAIIPLLDEASEAALAVGAVNTVSNTRGHLRGDNTDARGLARWMGLVGIDPRGRTALVLGAGGAARAAVWALAEMGAAEVRVLNRTVARAQQLVDALQPRLVGVRLSCGPLDDGEQPAAQPWAVVVNATSLGHHDAAPAVHPSCYSRDSVAIELVYNPPVTGFMRAARSAGARAENGLGMLVHQAALAFECWTGRPAPLADYERAAR